MARSLLQRKPLRDAEVLPFVGGLTLVRGRVHELCGPARHTAAVWAMQGMPGPVVWIAPAHARAAPNPQGLAAFTDPGRVIFVAPGRAEDLLWSVEEVLRSGAVGLVVADLPGPPALTPVRRLQLAAEAGSAAAGAAPTGLILTPGDGGAAGTESRWHLAPRHTGTARAWQLERRRARMAPPQAWRVTAKGREFAVSAPSACEPFTTI